MGELGTRVGRASARVHPGPLASKSLRPSAAAWRWCSSPPAPAQGCGLRLVLEEVPRVARARPTHRGRETPPGSFGLKSMRPSAAWRWCSSPCPAQGCVELLPNSVEEFRELRRHRGECPGPPGSSTGRSNQHNLNSAGLESMRRALRRPHLLRPRMRRERPASSGHGAGVDAGGASTSPRSPARRHRRRTSCPPHAVAPLPPLARRDHTAEEQAAAATAWPAAAPGPPRPPQRRRRCW